jgi:L-amino acid N-acyltransferase YncA
VALFKKGHTNDPQIMGQNAALFFDFDQHTMSLFDVRPATLRDAPVIAHIHVQAWKHAYEGLVADADLQTLSVDKRLSLWREAIEYAEPQVLVACDATKQVVGFIAFDRSRDPKTKSTVGEIWALYLLPEVMGQGAGSALWGAARDACEDEGFTEITAWVFAHNDRGLSFYDAMGFKREMKTLRTTPVGSTRLEELRVRFSLK